MKTFFTSICCLLFLFPSFSQSAKTLIAPPESKVKGTLVQQSTADPLPFATVMIFSDKDSSMVTSALTEEDGGFVFQLTPGHYYAVFEYVGFQDKIVSDLEIDGQNEVVNLGEITMRQDAVALQQVEIQAERSQMEFKLDRRVFNVGKDLSNAGYSAADVLDKVPSVTVDPEGNVSLRGSQSVRILVNGKPSGLLSAGDTEALLRLQGNIIESIEVITNPSARYEAEGEAGIINIILKKNKEKGINGSFGATLGYPHNYGASYNLNYRRRDFNFFSNFGLDSRRSPGGGTTTQRFFNNGQLEDFFETDIDQERGGIGGYLQLGTDWNINERNILTAALLYRMGEGDNTSTVRYQDFDGNDQLLQETVREVTEGEKDHNVEASLNYKRTYDNPDQEWTFTFKYILNDDTELADYLQTSDDGQDALTQRSSNTEDEANMLFQTDYIYPIGENSRLEGGLRAALRTVNNDFLVEELSGGTYVTLPSFDDQLEYTENIYAAYAIGGHEFGNYSIQLGLRAEYSDITAALLESDQRNDQNYLSFFPSASLSYKLNDAQQFQASYSRRLSRPYFRRLLPFSNFNNPRNNRIGNPNLRPEFSDSYELGYLQYFKKGSFLSSVYYRHTTGVIEELVLPGEDGTAISFPVNLSIRNSYGLEFNVNYDLKEWWSITGNANFFRALVDGSYEGVSYSSDTYTWTGRFNTKFDIGERIKLQASFDYNAPENTTQGRRLSSYNFDLAGSVDLFNGKGTLTIAGRDLFNTRQRRNIVDLPNYQSESVFQWRQTRQVVMTLNYRLNQDD